MNQENKLPLPPFSTDTAIQKVKMAENAWNNKDANKISMAYTADSTWRNRDLFINGRDEIVSFLQKKFKKETEYKLVKELWAFTGHRIAVRFVYEWLDSNGQWYRSYGNENWEFNPQGLMAQRHASINDKKIAESDRKFLWEGNLRPENYASLSDLGL
ncbi:COGs COG3558 [hydrothermal vent metagenome]|uniref:COGs COG3558 n=1 Tax=hydrothermal vent metagenome TaxID=652676 RepID=A0A1W1CM83_9ZZZZ